MKYNLTVTKDDDTMVSRIETATIDSLECHIGSMIRSKRFREAVESEKQEPNPF